MIGNTQSHNASSSSPINSGEQGNAVKQEAVNNDGTKTVRERGYKQELNVKNWSPLTEVCCYFFFFF
ncbi:hypothetical protein VNO77_16532 [Canavalia gladiata]|uniref:Uncharacterized protein n=1 Tax=Canavalia gladiata TaxID=3824 RepID=A0AAN9M166_CANGL